MAAARHKNRSTLCALNPSLGRPRACTRAREAWAVVDGVEGLTALFIFDHYNKERGPGRHALASSPPPYPGRTDTRARGTLRRISALGIS